MVGRVFSTSLMRPAATEARGRIIKIITSSMKAITTCMAYWEKTIISEKRVSLLPIPARWMRMAPIQ